MKRILLSNFANGVTPITALYAILIETQLHLPVQQISFLFAIWAGAYILFEIPTGALADMFSRKGTIALGLVVRGIGFTIWAISPNFWGLATGFIMWAFSIACWSGAEESLIHDESQYIKGASYEHYSGISQGANQLGTVAGYILAALFAHKSFTFLAIFSAIAQLISAAGMVAVKEHPREKHTNHLKLLKAASISIFRSKLLITLAIMLVIIHQIIGVMEEYIPRVFSDLTVSIRYIPLLIALTNLISVYALSKTGKISRLSMRNKIFVALLLCLLFVTGYYVSGVVGVAMVIIFNVGFVVMRLLFIQTIAKNSPPKERATISSVPGVVGGLIGVGMYALVGIGTKINGQRITLSAMTVSLGLILLLSFVLRRKYIQ